MAEKHLHVVLFNQPDKLNDVIMSPTSSQTRELLSFFATFRILASVVYKI